MRLLAADPGADLNDAEKIEKAGGYGAEEPHRGQVGLTLDTECLADVAANKYANGRAIPYGVTCVVVPQYVGAP